MQVYVCIYTLEVCMYMCRGETSFSNEWKFSLLCPIVCRWLQIYQVLLKQVAECYSSIPLLHRAPTSQPMYALYHQTIWAEKCSKAFVVCLGPGSITFPACQHTIHTQMKIRKPLTHHLAYPLYKNNPILCWFTISPFITGTADIFWRIKTNYFAIGKLMASDKNSWLNNWFLLSFFHSFFPLLFSP